jgi:hypothetical protein
MTRRHLAILISCCLWVPPGCTPAPEVFPCYNGTDPLPGGLEELLGDDLVECSQLEGVVCNAGLPIEEACIRAGQLRPDLTLPICKKVPEIESYGVVIGTCQPPDVHGTPCTNETNCLNDQNLLCAVEDGAEDGICEPPDYTTWTRLVYIYRRLPEMTSADFLEYWHNVHAPLVVQNAETLGIKGYIQLHTVDPVGNLMWQISHQSLPAYDGAGEYFVDLDTFTDALATQEGQQALQWLIDDKRNFADLSLSAVWLAKEHLFRQIPRSPGEPVKIFTWVGAGIPGLSPEEFQDYYLNNHGQFPVRHPKVLGVHEYIQIHAIDNPLNDILRTMHGTAAHYYVHLYSIWDFSKMGTPQAMPIMQQIFEDEPNFVDFTKSALWYALEHIIIPTE